MNKTFKGQFDTVVFMRDGKEYIVIIQEGLVYTRTKELFTGAITCELQANVIEGKFEGKWVQYYTEEEILTIFPELESFNEKRILVETFYKDGKKNGQWLQYHADGKLHIKTHYKDDKMHGEYFYYNRSGVLDFEGHYKEGLKEGECIFYKGGKILEKGSYKKDIRIGVWLKYNREGKVIKKTKH